MYLSTGNNKLKSTDQVKFLIWNLPAEKTCPFSTEMCKKFCYAKKAERQYKNVRTCRATNFNDSLCDSFPAAMMMEIYEYIRRPSWKNKEVLFRIHESGDFYNREYVEKWLKIARFYPNIQFLAYTKSVRFFVGLKIPDNMTIRFSVWDDTNPQDLETARSLKFPVYTAIDKEGFQNIPVKNQCNCSVGCGECGKCWLRNIDLTTEIH